MSTIELSQVRRLYNGAAAVDGVSLDAPAAGVLALLGPSGSGKSTILRLIAGLEPVDSGDIRLGGEIMSSPSRTLAPELRRVGMVFQDHALFPHMSAGANVAFGLARLGRAAGEAAARAWLDRVGLGGRADAYPHELSGGEAQRVALARTLATQPRIVLLDEPFSGLDQMLRAELREFTLTTLAETGTSAVFVTHDSSEALTVADKLAILKGGRLLQLGAPRETYDHPASPAAAAALGPVNLFAGRVERGAVATPFGAIAAQGVAEGVGATVIVRAEAISLRPGTLAKLRSLRPHGAHDLAIIEAEGAIWQALVPPRSALGERIDVTLQPPGAFAFSA
ncbi:MAG: ABC transporter ATP-binding protein [Terricaulis sp.]